MEGNKKGIYESLLEVNATFRQPKVLFAQLLVFIILTLIIYLNPFTESCKKRALADVTSIQTCARFPNEDVHSKSQMTSISTSIYMDGSEKEPKSLDQWHKIFFSNGWMLATEAPWADRDGKVNVVYHKGIDSLEFQYDTHTKQGFIYISTNLFLRDDQSWLNQQRH